MTQPAPRKDSRRPRSAAAEELTGGIMAMAGSLILVGLIFISNASAPGPEHLMFHLGLALTSLISAGAQVLVVAGIAILWSAARRNHKAS